MNITDINHDIARRDLVGTEDAFRALVGWPKEAEIRGASFNSLGRALVASCHALAHNTRMLPVETCTLVEDATGDDVQINTYAEAAAAVMSSIDYWTNQFRSAA